MYVIQVGTGTAVINGLNQIKVWESREDAQKALDEMPEDKWWGTPTVTEIHYVKEGE